MTSNGSVPFWIFAAQLRPSITSPPKINLDADFAGRTRYKSKRFVLRSLRSWPSVTTSGAAGVGAPRDRFHLECPCDFDPRSQRRRVSRDERLYLAANPPL